MNPVLIPLRPLLVYFPSFETRSSGKNQLPAFLWYNMDLVENDASNNSSTVSCIRCAGMCLPSRYLVKERGIHFTEPLSSNDRRDTRADTQTDAQYEYPIVVG
jgi:hypothetical protein